LQLLSSPASPFARKCRVFIDLLELGGTVETRDVTASPMGGEEALNAANPSGKIPALLRPGAATLYDSRVITRFLDAQGGGGLYPEDRLWEVLALEANADAVMEAAVGIVYELRFRPEEKVHRPWLEAQWAKVARSLDAAEAGAMPLLEGGETAASIAWACALGYLDFRHAERGWREGRPALAAWADAALTRPAMAATAPG
jgi:glutathione S-transferase